MRRPRRAPRARPLGPLALRSLALAAALALFAADAQAQTPSVAPPSGKWVTDDADLLSPTEEADLTARLRTYADSTSTQVVIVTLPTLDGQDPAMYATELGERWRVGQQGRDNGAVILVARDDRKMFIAVGKGLEGAVPDAIAARIVRDLMAPRFREGKFYDGLSAAVGGIMLAARGEFRADPRPASGGGGRSVLPLLLILFVVFLIVSSAARRGGGGPRGRRYRSGWGGPPVIVWGGGGGWGGGDGGGFGGGGFSGGGGSFGGGGAGGSW